MRVSDRVKQLTRVIKTWSVDGDSVAFDTASQLYEVLDTPTSLGLFIALKARDFDTIVNHSVAPDSYLDARSFENDYLAVSFLSKYPFTGREKLTRSKAVESFLEAENLCRSTNKRFLSSKLCGDKFTAPVHSILHGMQGKIASILGDFSFDEWHRNLRFGPGADTSHTGIRATVYDKISTKFSCTADSVAVALAAINSSQVWLRSIFGLSPFDDGPYRRLEVSDLDIVPGSKITFVPKNARTDRAIAIEPHLNIFLQLGIGAMIRSRLLRCGLNLNDQSANQRLARRGSILNHLATIDLTMASDTIARRLVQTLLPFQWFEMLDLVRSKSGRLPNEEQSIYFEKFSSMGNGFTFELESLIFYALGWAVCTHLSLPTDELRVYGDDIVIPSQGTELLFQMLEVLGFKANVKKSFSDGPFRESCGKDYYNGIDVRPVFLKEKPSNAQSIIRMANGLRRLAHRRSGNFGCDRVLRRPWLSAIRRLPKSLSSHLMGPLFREDGSSDDGTLGVSFEEATRSPLHRLSPLERGRGWDGVWYRYATVSTRAKLFVPKDIAAWYAAWLYGLGRGVESREIEESLSDRNVSIGVPFRSLATSSVSANAVSNGWYGPVNWV